MKLLNILLLVMISSCASAVPVQPPSWDLRTYRISESLDAFEYQWRINGKCIRKFLWVCRDFEELIIKEQIQFSDKVAIKKFLDAGFVLKQREMP